MKTIFLGRHSINGKNNEKDLISEEGAARMFRQGRQFRGRTVHRVFDTSLVRTRQSSHLFLAGAAQAATPLYQTITGLGNTEEFVPICPTEVMTPYTNKECSFWAAMERHFGLQAMEQMAAGAGRAVMEVFGAMNHGEISLVLAHDPFVSFAVWNLTGELPEICKDVPEGTIFELHEKDGAIYLVGICEPN